MAAHGNDMAFLVIGFEWTTKVIGQARDCECDYYQALREQLDEGGGVAGVLTPYEVEWESGQFVLSLHPARGFSYPGICLWF
jgi:hypothetical protein